MNKLVNLKKEFLNWRFEEAKAGELFSCYFEGVMTVWAVSGENKKFKTVLIKALLDKDFGKNKKIIFDCQKITEIDSAGLAMLLSGLRQSNKLGYEAKLAHVPQKALDLIEAQGVMELIKPFI